MEVTSWVWPWWSIMVAINVLNLAICIRFFMQSKQSPQGQSAYVTRMRIMGLIFTAVALYRAIFVSRYLYQYGWFDTFANSSMLIRLFAWSAELSFSGLIALAMLHFNEDIPAVKQSANRFVQFMTTKTPYILIGCIFTAQFFATSGLITKDRSLFAVEETLWGIGFLAILPLAFIQFFRAKTEQDPVLRRKQSMLRSFATVNLVWGVIYCSYSVLYHLPFEYWGSVLEQVETGLPVIKSGFSAVVDAATIVNVTHDYQDWGFGFFLWHSAYFSVCVWLAIFFMRAPRLQD